MNILKKLFKKGTQDHSECVHIPNKKDSTLVPIMFYKMVTPLKKYYKCTKCNKVFEFLQDKTLSEIVNK